MTSVDPLIPGSARTNPQRWNRYAYALNNPLRFVDPTGLVAESNDAPAMEEYGLTGFSFEAFQLWVNDYMQYQDENGGTNSRQSNVDKQGRRRPLTAEEIEEARRIFGSSIDYSRVEVRTSRFLGLLPGPMAPNNNIYWAGACGNLATCDGGRHLSTFIHEMTHVWQYQNRTLRVKLRGFYHHVILRVLTLGRHNPYDVTYEAGKPFRSYGLEQQGVLAEWIYLGLIPNIIR